MINDQVDGEGGNDLLPKRHNFYAMWFTSPVNNDKRSLLTLLLIYAV